MNEVFRPINRPIDMTLGCKVHHSVVALHCIGHCCRVADVSLNKLVARVVFYIAHRGQVACIGERIEHGDFIVGVVQDVAHVIGANETCSAGNELLHVSTYLKSELRAQSHVRLPLRGNIATQRVLLIAVRQDGVGDSPIGANIGIVPRHTQFVGRVVITINKIRNGHFR